MNSKSKLDYLNFDAEIKFNSASMLFEGTIIHNNTSEVFYGHSVNSLKKAYEQAVALIVKKDTLKAETESELLRKIQLVRTPYKHRNEFLEKLETTPE